MGLAGGSFHAGGQQLSPLPPSPSFFECLSPLSAQTIFKRGMQILENEYMFTQAAQ